MKVKEMIKQEISIDVYDNVCEELCIGFEGPVKLTNEGIAEFEIALNLDIDIDGDVGIVNVEDEFFPDLWEIKLAKAKQFFESCAGYCSEKDYKKWFVNQ